MPELQDATDVARTELLPLLESLCALTHEDGEVDQASFFNRIRAGIEYAQEPDDLAGPFMDLSTSAFRGFAFSAPVSVLLDTVLGVAHTLSSTLSASNEEPV